MIVILSGEGPSDLGYCFNGQDTCMKPDFRHGPMTLFVDREIESAIGFSLLESTPDSYIFVSKQALIAAARDARQKKSMSLRGKRRPEVETGYFYLNAKMLGHRAKRLEEEINDRAIAILFRDCDGTRSDAASLWQDKVNSIRQGFSDAGLGKRGVAMVPKPKSESWMLCVLRDNYQQCVRLEQLSGNDDVPDSAKNQLNTVMAGNSSTAIQLRHLSDAAIDIRQLATQMPSYHAFHQDMVEACREMMAF